MRVIDDSIPERLRSALRSSGDRKLIFVEGKTDEKIYAWLFKSKSSSIHFEKCGSKLSTVDNFNIARNYLEEKYVHAILDKDFDEDNIVEACLNDKNEPFRLNWFSIENYLLNFDGIIGGGNIFLDLGEFDKKISAQVEDYIRILCDKLLSFSAAHKVSMQYGEKKPGIGHEDIDAYVKTLSEKTDTPEEELRSKINQQVDKWRSTYNFLKSTDYYKIICGKRIIHFLHKEHKLKHPQEFKNFLVNYIADHNAIPENLLDIINKIIEA